MRRKKHNFKYQVGDVISTYVSEGLILASFYDQNNEPIYKLTWFYPGYVDDSDQGKILTHEAYELETRFDIVSVEKMPAMVNETIEKYEEINVL